MVQAVTAGLPPPPAAASVRDAVAKNRRHVVDTAEVAGMQARVELLSARQRQVMELAAAGLSNKEIARSLDIRPETVKSYLKSVFAKLGVERRAQAVSRAQTLGLVTTQ